MPLQEGNLVLDMPVPSGILVSGKTTEEMTHLRYSAVTCDPDDFVSSKVSIFPVIVIRSLKAFLAFAGC